MRANPDGTVALSEAIGREADVETLWAALTRGSTLLQARRGLGKTTLARLALADAPATWSGLRVDVGALEGPAHAARAVLVALEREHPRAPPELGAIVQSFTPASTDWAQLLRRGIGAILDHDPGHLVLALDDFDQLRGRGGGDPCEDDLGALAEALVQAQAQHPRLRSLLVFEADPARLPPRARAAVADFEHLTLGPLLPEASARLASALIAGESLTALDRVGLATELADGYAGVPRWLHCALAALVQRRKPVVDGDVERGLEVAALALERAPWRLRRDLAPVLDAYLEPQRGLSLAVLDILAVHEGRPRGEDALTFRELRVALGVEMTIDGDAIQRVLSQLGRDQILEEFGGRWRFCAGLLGRAWATLRGLS